MRSLLFGLTVATALHVAIPQAISEPAADPKAQEAVIDALLEQAAPPPDWREFLKQRPQPVLKAPDPDASVNAVLDYWRGAPETAVPDAATQVRLLEACEGAPEEFPGVRQSLALDSPNVQDRLKKIYDRIATERTEKTAQIAEVLRDELMHHSHYFREELIRRAFLPDDIRKSEATKSMASLIRLDRTGAKKLLLKESSDRDLQHRVLAIAALLQEFRSELETKEITDLNLELKRLAADPKSPTDIRRRALLQAASNRTPETERWFLDLFRDQSLNVIKQFSAEPAPLAEVVAASPDYWIPKVAALVERHDPAVHANAVYALIQFRIEKARADALRPLLPWLDDPAWAFDSGERLGRLRLIQSLDRVDLPEAVPGLLKVAKVATGYELRGAAEALAHYDAREAIEPLKRGLEREMEAHHRWALTRALLKLNGFSQHELVESLRAYALKISTPTGQKEVEDGLSLIPMRVLDYRVSVGQEIARTALSDDALAKAVLEEAELVTPDNPTAADLLRQFVAKWQTPSASKETADRLRAGEITADWIKKLIESRTAIAASLVQLRDLKGTALGIQAALTAESSLVDAVLAAPDRVAQRALLAVARLARVELPIEPVSQFLTSADKPLVRAAELYLEALDTANARNILWEHFKDQAHILGYPDFTSSEWTGGFHGSELRARAIILREDGPREIHALLSEGTWGGRGQRILLVYKDRAILRCEDGNGRAREREVPQPELAALLDWLASERIDELPPFDTGTFDGVQYEYLHLSRQIGRRVYMNNPPGAKASARVEIEGREPGPDPAIYGELTRRFEVLDDGPTHVIYESLRGLADLRVVHPREKGDVTKIARHGDQLLAGIRIPQQEKTEWHPAENSGLKPVIPTPPELVVSKKRERYPDYLELDGVLVAEGPLTGKQLWPGTRMKDKVEGLWASMSAGEPQLIAKGIFARPLVCPGGEWIVVAKTFGTNMWAEPNGVVRIHLPEKRVVEIDLPPVDNFDPIVWIEARKRVLLYQQRDWRDGKAGPKDAEFYLLDPPTGKHEKVQGEFRPFFDAEKQALQPTGKPNEVWAVLHPNKTDLKIESTATIGRFDTHDFRFTPLVTCPDMQFDSDAVFVDEPAGAIWIAVNGDLLRLSLPSNSPPSK